MKIQELVRKFEEQDIKDTAFNLMLFLVADYTMYEQAIIKKDNISARESTIKYRYSKNSYRYVNEFFSKIQFLSKPIIGKGKTPVIKGLPDKHKFPMKHEVPFEIITFLCFKHFLLLNIITAYIDFVALIS